MCEDITKNNKKSLFDSSTKFKSTADQNNVTIDTKDKKNVENKVHESWINQTKNFVESHCPKGERDSSHGMEHFVEVVKNTIKILDGDGILDTRIRALAIITAWLHDLSDKKYDKSGRYKLLIHGFLNIILSDEDLLIVENAIESVSYSKQMSERKAGTEESWFNKMGIEGKLIRDIVSDADKLEALDEIGLERCILYTQHSYKEKYNKEISYDDLKENVINHSKEKLLGLKDFIYTTTGKILAEERHNNYVKALEEFTKETEEIYKAKYLKCNKKYFFELYKKIVCGAIIIEYTNIYLEYKKNVVNLDSDLSSKKIFYGTLHNLNNVYRAYRKGVKILLIDVIHETLSHNLLKNITELLLWCANTCEYIIDKIKNENIIEFLNQETIEKFSFIATKKISEEFDEFIKKNGEKINHDPKIIDDMSKEYLFDFIAVKK